jgi:hypothetical protein
MKLPKYFAAMETNSDGQVALAIAHYGDAGPELDEVKVWSVPGGEAAIDAVYRGMRAEGLDVTAGRVHGCERTGDVRARAIASALELAGAH